jgi:hypothetical protein
LIEVYYDVNVTKMQKELVFHEERIPLPWFTSHRLVVRLNIHGGYGGNGALSGDVQHCKYSMKKERRRNRGNYGTRI